VLAAPEAAISTLAGVSTVYVVEEGKVRQQQVTLGAKQGELVEVVSGLKGEETLATSNLNQLATGVSIQVGKDEQGQGGGEGNEGSSSARGGRGGGRRGAGRQ
jgi:uncharacterized membrane protein YgcG